MNGIVTVHWVVKSFRFVQIKLITNIAGWISGISPDS